MEIDQCLLESLPLGQRQRLVRRMRRDQVRAYCEREKVLLQRQAGHRVRSCQKSRRRVQFGSAEALRDAIVRQDDREVLRLLMEGVDPSTPITSGGSLLHLCARHNNMFAAEVLVERGLNVDQQDEDQWTPLHVACACDNSDVVLLLLLAGANVLLQDVNGNIPLDYCTEGSETSLILIMHLDENGVDMSSVHEVKQQRPAVMLSDVQHLVAIGGSVNQHNDNGVTLLHIACASGYKEVVAFLLENGADPQAPDHAYWTPLHLAAKYGQACVVTQLLQHKANPNTLNCNEDKPSDVAAVDHIKTMLLRAEEYWEQSLADPSTPAFPDEHYEEIIQDKSIPVKKLSRISLPISKRDSLLEKEFMFRDVSSAHTRLPSQDTNLDGHFSSTACRPEQVKLMPPAPSDDLASLSELTDSSLLYEMQKRFGSDQIYTYIGHILLMINPNKDLPIYSNLVSQLYLSSSGRLCSSLPPHIFSSAERAYHVMLQEGRPQCFLLSGESGSGKSETCKHIVKHLLARSCPKGFAMESRMKHVNCILEAFGHAKTKINSNSSRYIKFLSLLYCQKKRTLVKAQVNVYALESSRVVSQAPHQHNFNIFYLLVEGMSTEEKNSLFLSNITAHRYLSHGAPELVTTAGSHGREGFTAMRHALQALGFTCLEMENLFVLLAAVLHLGDVRFIAQADGDAAMVSDLQLVEKVSTMLQVSPEDLASSFTTDMQYIKGDVISRRHTVEAANHNRDLLAKSLYSRLFGYLVYNVNCYLQGPDVLTRHPTLEIGILDVFGLEELRTNGFEQLCINMTNEKLHHYVTEVLFQQEQEECLQEGVAVETLRSPGNQSTVLDFFFQKPHGLLAVVDEESQALRPSEQNLYKKLQTQLDAANANGVFISSKDGNGNPSPRAQGLCFTVTHFSGKMTYDLSGVLEKNKDTLPQNILSVMKSSENVVIRQTFQSKLTQTGSLVAPQHCSSSFHQARTLLTSPNPIREQKNYLEVSKLLKKKGVTSFLHRLDRCGPGTVAAQLRNSLAEITRKLQDSTPHFVQCIRPNSNKQAENFDSLHISAQLQYVGVLEMVRMIRYGYPVRLPFSSFLNRYKDLSDTTLGDKKLSLEDKCRHILHHCKLQGWQIGRSKVFLRYWQADHLNDRSYQLHRKIVTCQKVVRGWLARRRLLLRVRTHQQQQSMVLRFLQGVEDQGLLSYDRLVIQNASDIARENDRLRGHLGAMHLVERPEPVGAAEEPPKSRTVEKSGKVSDGGGRTLKHFRSSSVPVPLALENPARPASHPPDEGGGGGGGLSSPRKQPPPKPKRDPNTRLSASYEAVSACLSIIPKESSDDALSKPRPHSDDYSTMKKIPPPKPKRSPNTRLTSSYEEIPVSQPTEGKLPCVHKTGRCAGLIQRAASTEGPHHIALSLCRPQEEDIYIEMVGHPGPLGPLELDSPEQCEAVYEEMKYFLPEDGEPVMAAPVSQDAKRLVLVDHFACRPQGKGGPCEIPPPFPNLLPHRPPLLVFPPSPVTCSPASDESPLTPLEVKKLPVLDTSISYSGQGDIGSPLSPQYARQRADSSPSLSVFMPDKSTPPLTPPPPLPPSASLPPPYRPPSHFPFPPETPTLTRAASLVSPESARASHKFTHISAETPTGMGKPPFSPAKTSRPEPRRALSCSSSPLLFNPASTRALTSPMEELNTLFSSGRSLLRKSATGRKIREPAFNSNINHPDRDDTGTTMPSPQLQDRNANHNTASHQHHCPGPQPAHMENGNQLSNGSLEEESHTKSTSVLYRHMDSHHSQVIQQLSLLGNESVALQELLQWRRKMCEERSDWQHMIHRRVGLSPPPVRRRAPTLLRKTSH